MDLTPDSNVVVLRPELSKTSMPDFVESNQLGPIETKMRDKLSGLKGSKYPDNFDWGVYDRIASRYGDNQPRGGVVFKTTFKLVNHHSTCTKCHYAFEIDSYGRGCIHNCAYCYAKEQLSAYGYWNRPMPFPVDLAEIRKVFFTVFETNKPNQWREILEQRIPLRLGSMSDSFMWTDLKYGVTKELLKILNFYEYPYVVFTRSDLAAHDEYISLLAKPWVSVQFSISGNNEALTKAIEPGAPNVQRRFEALKKLAGAGIWTAVRINPLFPTRPDGFLSDREAVLKRFGSLDKVPELPLYDNSFFDQIREADVKTVIAGFVRLSPQAVNSMSKATGVDIGSFFSVEELKTRGDKRFSDREISEYYRWFKNECSTRALRFTTCYIGNGAKDYFQYKGLWSNKNDCCDLVSNLARFKKTSQDIPWEQRMKHAPTPAAATKSREIEEAADSAYENANAIELT